MIFHNLFYINISLQDFSLNFFYIFLLFVRQILTCHFFHIQETIFLTKCRQIPIFVTIAEKRSTVYGFLKVYIREKRMKNNNNKSHNNKQEKLLPSGGIFAEPSNDLFYIFDTGLTKVCGFFWKTNVFTEILQFFLNFNILQPFNRDPSLYRQCKSVSNSWYGINSLSQSLLLGKRIVTGTGIQTKDPPE